MRNCAFWGISRPYVSMLITSNSLCGVEMEGNLPPPLQASLISHPRFASGTFIAGMVILVRSMNIQKEPIAIFIDSWHQFLLIVLSLEAELWYWNPTDIYSFKKIVCLSFSNNMVNYKWRPRMTKVLTHHVKYFSILYSFHQQKGKVWFV